MILIFTITMVEFNKLDKAIEQMNAFLVRNNLKSSHSRNIILKIFLNSTQHLTSEELYNLTKGKIPNIGMATIYRTLKLFCDCGIASELHFSKGKSRYEPLFNIKHHDHLICKNCGQVIEVCDDEIERLQESLSEKHNFMMESHKLEIYGLCKECRTN